MFQNQSIISGSGVKERASGQLILKKVKVEIKKEKEGSQRVCWPS
jgi:hypothetical protein